MAFHNSILSNVYNYYQADLSPKSTSRFDAHKRADLRSIYHSIRNIDKESPVYLIDRSADLEKYVVHMKENAIQFRNVMDSLGYEDEETLFSKKTIVSSHPDIATVEYTGKEQVAEDFGMSTSGVKKHIMKALKMLREEFGIRKKVPENKS